MRVLGGLSISAVVICGLAACDPLYGVGARQYLTPLPSRTDSTSTPRKDASAPPALDIPRTADCLEAALRQVSSVSDVHRWDEPKSVVASQAGMSFALSDSGLGARPRYANLTLGTRYGERPALYVAFNWIGAAGNVPTQEQEAMVRATAALVQQLRRVCLPDVAESIECVAGGLGRRRVCLSSH